MKKHNSVILFAEWKRPLRALDLEQKGRILDALLDFPEGIRPDFEDPMLAMAWNFMQGGLEENARKWDEVRARRAEAGKRGNEKRWHGDNANGKNRKCDPCDEEIANVAVSVSASDTGSGSDTGSASDTGSDTDSGSGSAEETEAAAASRPPTGPARFVPPELEAVQAYFAGKGGTAEQAQRFRDYYESNGWLVGRNPMKSWQAAASCWIARDKAQPTAAPPRGRAFLNSRPPEEAAKAGNFLSDAAHRRPLTRKKDGAAGIP